LKLHFADAANCGLHEALSISSSSPPYEGNHSGTVLLFMQFIAAHFSESRSNYTGSGFGCTLEL